MTGFDGLLVNHAALDRAAQDLAAGVNGIQARMDALSRDLVPLSSGWSGEARAAYDVAKVKWDTAIFEMAQLLGRTSASVSMSNQDYHAQDVRSAYTFQL